MARRKIPKQFDTLDEAFIYTEKTMKEFKVFVESLKLKDEKYRVQIWDQLRHKGRSLDSLKKMTYKIIFLEYLRTETIEKLIKGKNLGLENIFELAANFSTENQIEYMILVNPSVEEKKTGIIGGKKSKAAIKFWNEKYNKDLNLSEAEAKLASMDTKLFNPYDEYIRNDND